MTGTDPPLWRGLELASDLYLDQVHDVIQTAFGWTDSHLHRFSAAAGPLDPGSERYLCPVDVAEGEPGVPEEHVRLDEVLTRPGERLFYVYDFGDAWEHVLTLEAVLPGPPGGTLAICTDGARPGPAEDCGGAQVYGLVQQALAPGGGRATAELRRIFGDEVEVGQMSGTPFDRDLVNADLAHDWGPRAYPPGVRPADLSAMPPQLTGLLDLVRASDERRMLRRLLDLADLTSPAVTDERTAAAMVRPYAWLLDRIGDGIRLTSAGFLPPAVVSAAVTDLGLADEWIGKGNREAQTLPVLLLRESAQRAGLLRKYSGQLLLTPRGRKGRHDPVALWRLLAAALPVEHDEFGRQAGLVLLVLLAAGRVAEWEEAAARLLCAIGWRTADGDPVTGPMALQAAWDTEWMLRRIGALAAGEYPRPAEPGGGGRAFARMALVTWPAA